MYKISVPIYFSDRIKKEESLSELKRCGATRVFIGVGTLSLDNDKFNNMVLKLRELVTFYKDNGLEVGIWIWTFWRKDIQSEEKDILLRMSTLHHLHTKKGI